VFKARFGGVAREISVPVGRVIAIYARENGQGMSFPAPASNNGVAEEAAPKTLVSTIKPVVSLSAAPPHLSQDADEPTDPNQPSKPSNAGTKPHLKRIK
jgi:stringent starvation protein B